MIYFLGKLLYSQFEIFSFFRLADSIMARAIGAALTAILLTLSITPMFIRYLHKRGVVDQWRSTGVASPSDKTGTPAMGGMIVIGCVLVSCLLWCNLLNKYILSVLVAMVFFGLIGMMDDVAKAKQKSGDHGLSESAKLVLQACFAAAFAAYVASPLTPLPPDQIGTFYIPFVKAPLFDSVWFYLPIVFFFVLVVGNSVNITDGLDGLAIVPSLFVIGVLGIFGYILGNFNLSDYLIFTFMQGSGELTVFSAA
ncbi:MAG: hypothetical protein P8Z37_17705, partial [Acidobacteriota bacterium]